MSCVLAIVVLTRRLCLYLVHSLKCSACSSVCAAVSGAEESLSLEDEKLFLQRQLDALKLQLGE